MWKRRAALACTGLSIACGPDVRVLEEAGGGSAASGAGSEGGAGGALATGGAGGAPSEPCPADWVHILGGSGANWARSQAVGPDGAVAVTVDSTADLTFDGAPLSQPNGGFVLVKLSRTGELEWTRHFGFSSQQPTLPVRFDPAGNIFVGGVGYQSVAVGDLSASQPGAMGYVAKLSPDGEPLWIRSWPVPNESAGLVDLAVDDDGAAVFQASLGYEDTSFQWGDSSVSGGMIIGKIDPEGAPVWARGFSGSLVERHGLAVAPDGGLVIGDSLALTATFGDVQLSTDGDFDALLLELGPDGDVARARQYGDDQLQRVDGLVIAPNGHRFLWGITWGEIDFGQGPVTTGAPDAVFLTAFGLDGENLWTKVGLDEYASHAMFATSDGGLSLLTSAAVAEAFGCAGARSDGSFVEIRLDAEGACHARSEVIRCGDEPYCEIHIGGIHSEEGRTVSTGTFSSEAVVGGETFTADIWDGYVMSQSTCGEPR